MLGIIVQLAIVGLWASMLIIHTRRLLRMAQLEVLQVWDGNRLRRKLTRLWWWLGRGWHNPVVAYRAPPCSRW